MRKPTICIGENKDADQLRVTAKLISAFVFATRIVQSLFYLYPKFQASHIFLCLCSLICVGPVQKPHCWFSHEAAHLSLNLTSKLKLLTGNVWPYNCLNENNRTYLIFFVILESLNSRPFKRFYVVPCISNYPTSTVHG